MAHAADAPPATDAFARHGTQTPDLVVAARALVCGYGAQVVVPSFSCTFIPGEFWAVVGDNGTGKSTLLATLLGLQAPLQA